MTPHRDMCTAMSIAALCTIAVEPTEVFNNRGIREMWSIFKGKKGNRDWNTAQ